MELLKEFWEGKITLWKSYWLGGVIIYQALSFIFLLIIGILELPQLAWLIVAAYIFVMISIWRSASNYTGPKGWAILAKVVVILAIAPLIQATIDFTQGII